MIRLAGWLRAHADRLDPVADEPDPPTVWKHPPAPQPPDRSEPIDFDDIWRGQVGDHSGYIDDDTWRGTYP